jgi:hypothetical protein
MNRPLLIDYITNHTDGTTTVCILVDDKMYVSRVNNSKLTEDLQHDDKHVEAELELYGIVKKLNGL